MIYARAGIAGANSANETHYTTGATEEREHVFSVLPNITCISKSRFESVGLSECSGDLEKWPKACPFGKSYSLLCWIGFGKLEANVDSLKRPSKASS